LLKTLRRREGFTTFGGATLRAPPRGVQHRLGQAQIGDQLLELPILVVKLFQSPDLRHTHAGPFFFRR